MRWVAKLSLNSCCIVFMMMIMQVSSVRRRTAVVEDDFQGRGGPRHKLFGLVVALIVHQIRLIYQRDLWDDIQVVYLLLLFWRFITGLWPVLGQVEADRVIATFLCHSDRLAQGHDRRIGERRIITWKKTCLALYALRFLPLLTKYMMTTLLN